MIYLPGDLRSARTWEATALLLGDYGHRFSRALWCRIGDGDKTPTREQINIFNRYAGLPEIQPAPADLVRDFGIEKVIKINDDPDLVMLVRVGNAFVHSVNIRVGGEPSAKPPKTHVTQGNRKKQRALVQLGYPDLGTPQERKTRRGYTGNLERIVAVLSEAADALHPAPCPPAHGPGL